MVVSGMLPTYSQDISTIFRLYREKERKQESPVETGLVNHQKLFVRIFQPLSSSCRMKMDSS
jgi:hypothetical protein